MINVLFVCLGNICRSPMAEAVFQRLVEQEGLADQFHIDSVGTSNYHTGDPAYPGTRQILAANGIRYYGCSRTITTTDLNQADYIISMDHSNKANVQAMSRRTSPKGQMALLLDFAEKTNLSEVPDPYYTNNFTEVYRVVDDGCRGLLAHIRQEQAI